MRNSFGKKKTIFTIFLFLLTIKKKIQTARVEILLLLFHQMKCPLQYRRIINQVLNLVPKDYLDNFWFFSKNHFAISLFSWGLLSRFTQLFFHFFFIYGVCVFLFLQNKKALIANTAALNPISAAKVFVVFFQKSFAWS